ncbi:alpha-hydroxy-acid oxidizing protein [Nocardia sp. NPDC051570]|uniref:alpha-hydroxy-acid oxidizing protein n=1 Tax=Nocardia sp. NPDC051570 TaxID=3364324 RepID=UPI003793E9A4
MSENFGDFQMGVYAAADKGVTSRFPFDYRSIERKAAATLPEWVYRYVSAAAGDGRTQQANIDAYAHYGIVPRMMVSPPQRDLSIDLFGKRLDSPIFMCPIGLVGLCSPDFQGDVAAARASAATGVPFTLSTFSQAPMEDVIKQTGVTPSFFQLYLPGDRELAASLIGRAEAAGYSALVVTVDTWTLGFRPSDLERGNFPQSRGYCMENYYSDENFTRHLAKPPHEDQPAALAHYAKISAHPLTWEDLRWIRSQTTLPIAVKGIQHADDARMAIDNGADVLYCTNHGGRQANSGIPALQLLPAVVEAAGSTPVMFDSGVRDATDAVIALALGAAAVGIGRPYAYALSYGGTESLTHYLKSFLAEFDLMLAICGFTDIATLKQAGVERTLTAGCR